MQAKFSLWRSQSFEILLCNKNLELWLLYGRPNIALFDFSCKIKTPFDSDWDAPYQESIQWFKWGWTKE